MPECASLDMKICHDKYQCNNCSVNQLSMQCEMVITMGHTSYYTKVPENSKQMSYSKMETFVVNSSQIQTTVTNNDQASIATIEIFA